MNFYIIPLIFLSLLTAAENTKKLKNRIKNRYIYSIIAFLFIIFIGLRYQIGCDWDSYTEMFDKYKYLNLSNINLLYEVKGQELGHIFLTKISKNIYILNTIYAIIFVIPLFYFCSKIKRTYLSLLISYPYYIVVIGMGPIRQASCISILMISILLVSNKKYYLHFIITIFTLLLHQFSFFFNGIILTSFIPELLKIRLSKKNVFIFILLLIFFVISLPSMASKIIYYFTSYEKIYSIDYGKYLNAPAKSVILIWILNLVPSLIYLRNISKFNFGDRLNKIFITFSIFEFTLLPILFFNSVIAYRILLYLFPSSIYITSHIPDTNIFKLKTNYLLFTIITTTFISLIIWLKFAYHSYCWVPYKNILFN